MDFIFLLVLFFISFTCIKNQDYNNQKLSIQTTNNVQVVAVIFVIMHHLSQTLKDYPDSFLSSRLIVAGRLAVGLFFFISGYGLVKQYKKKGKIYLNTFLKKKVLSVLVPFFLAMIIYFIYRNLIGEMSIFNAFYSSLSGNPIVSNGWFVIMIIYLYLVFFVSATIAGKNDSFLILLLVLGVFLVIALANYLKYGEWWTNAVLCFPLGVIWSTKEKEITNILFRNYQRSLGVVAVLFSCFFYIDEIFLIPSARAMSVLLFVSLVVLISYKRTFEHSVYHLIKVISFELYLYQGLFIQLFRSKVFFVENRLLYVCLVIFATTAIALIMNRVAKQLGNLFNEAESNR